jgi:hypothetical protein
MPERPYDFLTRAGGGLLLVLPLLALAALIFLDVARHTDAAVARIPVSDPSHVLPVRVVRDVLALAAVDTPGLSDRLARSLPLPLHVGPHYRLAPYAAPGILEWRFTRSEISNFYLRGASIIQPTGFRTIGFYKGARSCFGVSPDSLTTGETAMLCRLSVTPVFPHPDTLLLDRDVALEKLRTIGHLPSPDLESELNRPLALAPDHIPIW